MIDVSKHQGFKVRGKYSGTRKRWRSPAKKKKSLLFQLFYWLFWLTFPTYKSFRSFQNYLFPISLPAWSVSSFPFSTALSSSLSLPLFSLPHLFLSPALFVVALFLSPFFSLTSSLPFHLEAPRTAGS